MTMNKYDKKHLQDLQTIGKRIERIFIEATKEAARIGARIDQIDPERLFSFDDYPSTKKEIDKLLSELASSVEVAIVNGIESAWTLANNKNNELCDVVFGDNVAKLSQDQYRRYYSTNHDAMVAYREEGGNEHDDAPDCTTGIVERFGSTNRIDINRLARRLGR